MIGDALTFVVPGPPLPWQRARSDGRRRYTSPEQAAYQRRVSDAAFAAYAACTRPWDRDGRYAVYIAVSESDRIRRDVDNHAKQVLDSLGGIAWLDDSQVDRVSVCRSWDREWPHTTVYVQQIEDARPEPTKKVSRKSPTK